MAAVPTRPNQREHILDVALRLMAEQGAGATSMRQLAKACGLQVAAIYHYFDSKDALLAAVIDERRYGDRMADPPPIPADLPAADRLRLVFSVVWKGALDEEPIWRLLLGEGLRGEAAALPTGRALLAVLGPGFETWLADVVPEVVDPRAVAELMLGQLFAGFVRHIFDPDLDVGTIEREAADVLVAVTLPARD